MRWAITVLLISLAVSPVEGTSHSFVCKIDEFESGDAIFATGWNGKDDVCPGTGALTVLSKSGKVLGTLPEAGWSEFGPSLPTAAAGKIIWYREPAWNRELELLVTDLDTWTTVPLAAKHPMLWWWADSGALGAITATKQKRKSGALADTIHVVDLTSARVKQTAHVERLARWPARKYHVSYLRPRNDRGEFFFLLAPEPTLDLPPPGPWVFGLYTQRGFEYHELRGIDYLSNIDLAVSPACMKVAVKMGTGMWHEMPHSIWILDLVANTTLVVTLPPKLTVVELAWLPSGELQYRGYDHAGHTKVNATLRHASCPVRR